jgi:23S rRNA-/tRNA-specific pseudouridylate synthase
LLTGFKHQIRCQLAAAGHPIVGDALYGSTIRAGGGSREEGIGLFAAELVFRHPIAGTEEICSADPAPFWPWTDFG